MLVPLKSIAVVLSLSKWVSAIPAWGSLAGLSDEEIEIFSRTVTVTGAQPPPGPMADTSSILIHDAAHPWIAPGPDDIRGPCPGLNTLASHGYLNRSGIATPQEIVEAVQTGFNMENELAVFVTWGAFIVDGNHLTNLMSIGEKSAATGVDPPPPAIVGGLNTHKVFEGDASTTRGDFYFGNNFSFNETLFDQLVKASVEYGGGKYNEAAAAQVRWNRIQDSMARNPTFDFTTPRYFTAYVESAFPYRFFPDGRLNTTDLDLDVARDFFQKGKFPNDWYRRNGSFGIGTTPSIGDDTRVLAAAHPISPGHNEGAGNYTLDPEDPGMKPGGNGTCYLYTKQVNATLRALYPNPSGALKTALQQNVATFFGALNAKSGCTEVFPYGE